MLIETLNSPIQSMKTADCQYRPPTKTSTEPPAAPPTKNMTGNIRKSPKESQAQKRKSFGLKRASHSLR